MKFKILVITILAFNSFSNKPNKLPRILLIGDSISIGYLPYVQETMKGKAWVDRIPLKSNGNAENCKGTTNGLHNIDRWLGDTKWDLIHFNFGLHDIKHVKPISGKNSNNPKHPQQSNLKQYKKNLKEIVKKLKATRAQLIFATTTPYPAGTKPFRAVGDEIKYNRAAIKIMKKNDIEINDLHSFVKPRMQELLKPVNVHFTDFGYKEIAIQVSQCITKKLENE